MKLHDTYTQFPNISFQEFQKIPDIATRREIAKRNNMELRDTLYAGQPLIIPLRGGKAPKTGIDEEMTEEEPMM